MVENQSNRHDKCSKTPPTTGWAIWALLIVVVLLGSGASVLTKRRSEECIVAFSDSTSCEASIHVNTVEQVSYVRGVVIVMDFIVGVNLVIYRKMR